jgi:hypothetical protein
MRHNTLSAIGVAHRSGAGLPPPPTLGYNCPTLEVPRLFSSAAVKRETGFKPVLPPQR